MKQTSKTIQAAVGVLTILLVSYSPSARAGWSVSVGKNGIGKTNVLDAIYHLSYGKSYFNPLAVQNIKHGEDFFVIDGEFEKAGRTESGLSAVDIKKPSTYPRLATDTITGAKTLFNVANMLKDHTSMANALRLAFQMVYPGSEGEQ